MDAIIEVVRFLSATIALLAWTVGHAARVLLRLLGRRSERLTRFLVEMKEGFGDYWLALAGIAFLVLSGLALVTTFERAAWLGWATLGLLVLTGLASRSPPAPAHS